MTARIEEQGEYFTETETCLCESESLPIYDMKSQQDAGLQNHNAYEGQHDYNIRGEPSVISGLNNSVFNHSEQRC